MAGGGIDLRVAGARAAQYEAKITPAVIIICLVAASGGLLFGYDLGVTGGVASLDNFLGDFFPSIVRDKAHAAQNPYCQYDSQLLQLWTSTMFIAGAVAGLVAALVTRRFGRRLTMIVGGLAFLIGTGLLAGAVHISMLFLGRVFLGIGVGFANQAVPLYLSEMAPHKIRGGLNICFQLATTIGILAAQCINYGTSFILPWGWRLSLGLAGVPASMLFLGGLCLPDTPVSLIQRGKPDMGRKVLERIRGTKNVDAEFADMLDAVELSKLGNWRKLFTRQHRPQLTAALLIPFFQQFTGINAIMFYAPQIFNSLGSGKSSSLLSAVIIGAINCAATLIAIFTVDRFGRKVLFLEGGVQMIVAEVATGIVMAATFHTNQANITNSAAVGVLVLICIFVSGFAWSWGPLGWLVPSEIHTIETRSAGQAITVSVNFLFSFVIGQSFLSMLCHMRFGVYFFFAFWVCVMTLYTMYFLPETKGVPIEEMQLMWRTHWFWRRVVTTKQERRAKHAPYMVDEKEAQMTQLPPKDRSPINSVDEGSKPKV
ncbi:Sugar transport protein MST4 [Coccomyxa sp. Obi]|nr:Sugar transport protein MST4 [Coccomyxa sp. Obi]